MDSKKERYEQIRAELENERSSFLTHWRDLSDFLSPRRSRFFPGDTNKGDKRNSKILDSTQVQALNVMVAGMTSGITSPARPWFKLTTPDPALADVESVKGYLYTVEERMRTMFIRSNLYSVLPELYSDTGAFGTGCMLVEEDFETGIRCYSFPIGEYMIDNDDKGKVCVFVRRFQMTVRQIVKKFKVGDDWSNISSSVKNAWDKNQRGQWVEVCHIILPNDEYEAGKIGSKKYISCYYENGTPDTIGGNEDKMLRESGYDYFPVLVARWKRAGNDVYGTNCPGMTALGDIKQLQDVEKSALRALKKMVDPPMVAPVSMKNHKLSIMAGEVSYVADREAGDKFRPAHETNINHAYLENKQAQVRERINKDFYVDLFLMMAQSDRRDITATEIAERREEKMLTLGPVLENLNEMLDQLIDIAFEILVRQRLLPEPPAELQGVNLKVEYVSIMAQAQKLVSISGYERFTGYLLQLAQANPTVLDAVDADKLVADFSEITGLPPGIIKTADAIAAVRDQRNQAAMQQQAAETAKTAGMAASQLASADTSGDNALTRMLQMANTGNLVGTP